jgi:hypothetical protein
MYIITQFKPQYTQDGKKKTSISFDTPNTKFELIKENVMEFSTVEEAVKHCYDVCGVEYNEFPISTFKNSRSGSLAIFDKKVKFERVFKFENLTLRK